MPGVRFLLRYNPLLIDSVGVAGSEVVCLKCRKS